MTVHPLFSTRRLSALLLATLGVASAAAAPQAVPFKASVRTQEVLHIDPAACPSYPFLAGTTVGAGTASHLGAVALVAGDCIAPSPGTFSFHDGKLTLTAANGDRLTAVYSGTLQPVAGSALPIRYTLSGTVTITGGTGRFVGASGSGYLSGTENLVTGEGQFEVTATLVY